MEFSGLPTDVARATHGCSGTAILPSAYAAPGSSAIAAMARSVQNGFGTADLAGPVVNELLVQMQSFDTLAGRRRAVANLVERVNAHLPSALAIPKPKLRPANILLIASTNRADGLDPALLRPGRFDRTLTFDPPDRAGRRALIDHFLNRKAHAPDLDEPDLRDALAAVTSGWSPAMLEHVFDEALVTAVRRGDAVMTWPDVQDARLTEEVGLGQPVGYTVHEKRLIATHEAGHCVAAWMLAPQRRLEVLTIIKRRSALGLLAHGDREDVFTRSRAELIAMVRIALAGQCVEELFFGDVSTGPAGDLLYATNVAAEMVGSAGMTGSLVSYAAIQHAAFSDSNLVARVLADDRGRDSVERLLADQKAYVLQLLAANRHLVEALRDALLDRHELIGDEITDVLEAAAARCPARWPLGATADAGDVTVIDLSDDGTEPARAAGTLER